MKYGYIRDARNYIYSINKQTKILKSYNLDEIIVERTGNDLKTLLESLQPGDELHVVNVDRLTRSVNEFITIFSDLTIKNVKLYQNGVLINPSLSFNL